MVRDLVKKEDQQNKRIPKEISQDILKKMFGNLLRAVGLMFYFIVLILAYSRMKQERLIKDIEVFAGAFLMVGMILLEKAYKKDDISLAITGIEFLFLSLHSLSIMYVITLFQFDFKLYLLASAYIISIYYVLKAIILYTKGRNDYLKSLSDISEIVKKDEPIKKEAKKRNEGREEEPQPKVSKNTKKIKEGKNSKTAKKKKR